MIDIPGSGNELLNSNGSEYRFDFHLRTIPRLRWKAKIGNSYGAARPLVEAGRVYTDQDGHPIILDASTGTLLKREETNHTEEARCTSTGAEVIYSVGRDSVTAVNANDGATKWSHQLRRTTFYGAHLVVANDVVYVGGHGKAGFRRDGVIQITKGYVLALDAVTGDLLWIYTTCGDVKHTPVVSDGNVYLGDGYGGHYIYCLSAMPRSRLGECLWRYRLNGQAEQGTVGGNTVYWGCSNGFLYALDAKSGALHWKFQAGERVADKGPPCIFNDWVFVGSKDGYLYGLDAQTGALRWKYFVVDDEAWEAAEREEAERLAGHYGPTEDEDEEEHHEREGYEAASNLADEKEEEQVDSNNPPLPSSLDLSAWVAEGWLYMLTTQGFLHCFELPETVSERRLST